MNVNPPTIGYVWIMRVFLMAAIIIVPLERFLRKVNFCKTMLILVGIVLFQSIIILGEKYVLTNINIFTKYVFDEILPYVVGYTPLLILGLKIRNFSKQQINILLVINLFVIIILAQTLDSIDVNNYKYPPQSLYILYGLFASALLWRIRPWLGFIRPNKFIEYLSVNSMWIYLWHIIPCYIVSRWANIPNAWFGRFLFVLVIALFLERLYKKIINLLPSSIAKAIG